MTARLRDWQSRLAACLAERMGRPFAWGSHDCVMFAADCVEACTGSDPARAHRGTYSDAIGAARVVVALGGLAAVAAASLGPEVRPLAAQPGDIGIVSSDGRDCLAVCIGSNWFAPGGAGLVPFPFDHAKRAWSLTPSVG